MANLAASVSSALQTQRRPGAAPKERREDTLVKITRRVFANGLAAVAFGAALFAGATLSQTLPAAAEDVDIAKLMKAGPLGDESMGKEDAPVTLIEYASLTCSHCAHFHGQTFPEIKKKYIDTGKVRFIFREFPFDPRAAAGFMLARCAPGDAYFPMLDLLFDQQAAWAFGDDPVKVLFDLSKQVGFTQKSFNACLTNQKVLDGVNWVRDRAAKEFGVNSTPTFFVNGTKVLGALNVEEMEKILDEKLGE